MAICTNLIESLFPNNRGKCYGINPKIYNLLGCTKWNLSGDRIKVILTSNLKKSEYKLYESNLKKYSNYKKDTFILFNIHYTRVIT